MPAAPSRRRCWQPRRRSTSSTPRSCVASCFYLESLGGRPYALEAFTVVSNLAGVAIYLLLARAVFLPLLADVGLARLCALGTVLSFGVLSRCCAIETYALALALDVGLAALCIHGLTKARRGAVAGLLFVLAVGVHVTNVLTLPFVLALMWPDWRRGRWATVGAFTSVVAVGASRWRQHSCLGPRTG